MTGRASAPPGLATWLIPPAGAALLASVAFAAPLRFLGLALPEPVFACVPAFAWALIRPSIVAPLVLVGAGVILDLLWRTPLGFWPACLAAAYAVTFFLAEPLLDGGAVLAWGGYGLACAAALACGAALTLARSGMLADPWSLAWQWLATTALFPFAWGPIQRYGWANAR